MSRAPSLVYEDIFLAHRAPYPHPERPERLVAMMDTLRSQGRLGFFDHLPRRVATAEELCLAHTAEHVRRVQEGASSGLDGFDADTYLCRHSYEAASAAAGGLLSAIDAGGRSLCLVRPPGHHATADRAMGFCLFNNVAVAARYAQRKRGAGRVAIVDIDVHHGNGTQAIFWDDPSVLYCSMHQMPLYPGSGHRSETGGPGAEGSTVNVPVHAGCDDAEYIALFEESVLPPLRGFQADWVILSVGFDAMDEDPIGGLSLTVATYSSVTQSLASLAPQERPGGGEVVAGGGFLVALEGGYDLDASARGVVAVASVLTA